MNEFNVLGIAPTDDMILIKKAFAAKARECHPEEHPGEFKRLQAAYRAACRYAKAAGEAGGAGIFLEIGGSLAETDGTPGATISSDGQTGTEEGDSSGAVPDGEEEDSSGAVPDGEKRALSGTVPDGEKAQAGSVAVFAGERAPSSWDFDFSDVEKRQTDSREEFWERFEYLLWNPCLRNNKEAWRAFCRRPEYQGLLEEDSFRGELAGRILGDSYLYWNVNTLDSLAKMLKRYQKNKFALYETGTSAWSSFRRKAYLAGAAPKGPLLTSGQQKLLFEVEGTETLVRGQRVDMERYLYLYFAFAGENRQELERLHQSAAGRMRWIPCLRLLFRAGRMLLWLCAYLALPALLFMLGCFLLHEAGYLGS